MIFEFTKISFTSPSRADPAEISCVTLGAVASSQANEPVRANANSLATGKRLNELLDSFGSQLESYPLYISLDKDVMLSKDATVNWDSGHLTLPEVKIILNTFMQAAQGKLLGMDVLGDWSPVQTRGLLRRYLHWTEHPKLAIDPAEANRLNEHANLTLLNTLLKLQPTVSEPLSVPVAS